jgi:hypothetical protein
MSAASSIGVPYNFVVISAALKDFRKNGLDPEIRK